MAKVKSLCEIAAEYLGSVTYFEQDDKLIVLLPEGMKAKKTKLVDNKLDITITLDGLEIFTVNGSLSVPKNTEDFEVLSVEDAKHFE